MAIINIDKKTFEKEIGKLDDKMKNRIDMFGTPIEEVNENEIQLEIFPNRPDLLSYQGFKRSFLAFLDKKTGIKEYSVRKPEKNYSVIIDSSLKDIRPYTACAIVKGIKFDDVRIKEVIEIQEKLHNTIGRKRKKIAIGIYPLEKINLPIYFKALEPDKIRFTPLEFSREMSGLEILQRHPTGKEYAHLLAGKSKFPIFVDADKNILSMPPIINSDVTGKVTTKTKNVFIECSGFDFDILNKCLNMIVTALADMGGKIYSMELKYKQKEITPKLNTGRMKISLGNANKLLGLNLTEKEMQKLFRRMGHNYEKGFVEVPSWRVDILHEVDLIEELAIAYGYENFIPEIPEISTIGEEDKREILKRRLSEILIGLNMLEISNYHLTKKDDQFAKMGLNEKYEKDFVELEGSKTDYTILRKNLRHYLLKIFSENIDSGYPQKIFEFGKVFELDNRKNILETDKLSVGITPGNFTEAKQILEYIFRMLGLSIEVKEIEKFSKEFIDGRAGGIFFENKLIGQIGEIHPKILKNWKIKMPVALFEIDLEEILENLN